ncbi:MAG TPA: S-methyl-5-thioribose-1-phosphate isomerase, partial [Gammaproteobacteria bacterium]|nr:S-methyl-5-thioribose-1-phosphate isomerase [Gammaproteobacteria bacterium]
MRVNSTPYRTIWVSGDGWTVEIIDQTRLPWEWRVARLTTMEEAAEAIRSMRVRGAPLIGVTAAYGLCLALRSDPSDAGLQEAHDALLATRPTAINLRWALDDLRVRLLELPSAERLTAAYARAGELAEGEVETCRWIGDHGLGLIEKAYRARGTGPVNILTHCNA